MDSRSYMTKDTSSTSMRSLDYDSNIVEFKSKDVLNEVKAFLSLYPNKECLVKIDFKEAKEA